MTHGLVPSEKEKLLWFRSGKCSDSKGERPDAGTPLGASPVSPGAPPTRCSRPAFACARPCWTGWCTPSSSCPDGRGRGPGPRELSCERIAGTGPRRSGRGRLVTPGGGSAESRDDGWRLRSQGLRTTPNSLLGVRCRCESLAVRSRVDGQPKSDIRWWACRGRGRSAKPVFPRTGSESAEIGTMGGGYVPRDTDHPHSLLGARCRCESLAVRSRVDGQPESDVRWWACRGRGRSAKPVFPRTGSDLPKVGMMGGGYVPRDYGPPPTRFSGPAAGASPLLSGPASTVNLNPTSGGGPAGAGTRAQSLYPSAPRWEAGRDGHGGGYILEGSSTVVDGGGSSRAPYDVRRHIQWKEVNGESVPHDAGRQSRSANALLRSSPRCSRQSRLCGRRRRHPVRSRWGAAESPDQQVCQTATRSHLM